MSHAEWTQSALLAALVLWLAVLAHRRDREARVWQAKAYLARLRAYNAATRAAEERAAREEREAPRPYEPPTIERSWESVPEPWEGDDEDDEPWRPRP